MRSPMQRAKKTVHSWSQARDLFERWRKQLASVEVQLKRPRVIDVVPIDFVSGEPVEHEGKPTQKFREHLVYHTNADVTIRRPSGAILLIDNYEIASISNGKNCFVHVVRCGKCCG